MSHSAALLDERALQARQKHLPAAAAHAPGAANENDRRPGTDPMDFVRANRIHVEHGSQFIYPYLVIHPRELDPANEAALREKLTLTYSINNPSFYEAPERMAIALNLGQLVPVSLAATRSQLLDGIKEFNAQVDSGVDSALQQQLLDKQHPLAGIVRDVVENPHSDPVGREVLQNGLGMYLLLREKLTQHRCFEKLTDYVERSNTPDQVLQDLSVHTGITPIAVRQAAMQGGLDGVGKLLGLDAKYVADVKALIKQAGQQDLSYNLVEHWHIGRQLLGLDAPMAQKIAHGMQERIDSKIAEYRAKQRHHYDVPDAIGVEEARIAREDMRVLEPIQRQVLYAANYEICHTPENTADKIAFHAGLWGLHRRAANDMAGLRGTNRIYYAGHGSRIGSVGTLAHEAAHAMWPSYFDQTEVDTIDRLVGEDATRFTRLQRLMDKDFDAFAKFHEAYQAGDAQEKQAVIDEANERFAPYGIAVDGLFPHLADAKAFRYLVWDANDVLAIEGARYNRSGYDSTQERFREVVSRFAEMRQVSHHHEPAVLRFVAPGLTQVWERHYIPHLERVYHDYVAQQPNGPNRRQALRSDAVGSGEATVQPLALVEEQPTGTIAKVEERPQDPAASEPAPAETIARVEERAAGKPPAMQDQPRGAPVGRPAADACRADIGTPEATISALGAVNEKTLAAHSALQSMGVHC